jgi:3-hydroxyisobutyrate dehydrogenase
MIDGPIAFFGLGNMGLPMAKNLLAAGFEVRGFDPSPHAIDAAWSSGIPTATSAAEAADDAEIVITMLPSGDMVLEAYGPISGAAAQGATVIDCSTIAVRDARTASEMASQAGLLALDAPVSGGVVGAEAGTLTFMVGGDAVVLQDVDAVFEAMGSRVVHCGASGAGQAAKMCNNLILASSMIAVSEAFVLAESVGLDTQALFDVVSKSSGQCWALTSNCPVPGPVPSSPANAGFAGGFSTTLMRKDLRLAIGAAEAGHVDLALGNQALAMYEDLASELPDSDFSVVVEAIRQRSARAGGDDFS